MMEFGKTQIVNIVILCMCIQITSCKPTQSPHHHQQPKKKINLWNGNPCMVNSTSSGGNGARNLITCVKKELAWGLDKYTPNLMCVTVQAKQNNALKPYYDKKCEVKFVLNNAKNQPWVKSGIFKADTPSAEYTHSPCGAPKVGTDANGQTHKYCDPNAWNGLAPDLMKEMTLAGLRCETLTKMKIVNNKPVRFRVGCELRRIPLTKRMISTTK
ncbi:uncharacterized protein [Clytia hemisphaerica]|uniref:uncharacterized protein n=1 Tax=Clytia hemisphaerica TaxID=252671 RepID=UPI0034D738D2